MTLPDGPCALFPSLRQCGCTRPCRNAVPASVYNRVIPRLFLGELQSAFKFDKLKEDGITCILNVSLSNYHQRPHLRYWRIQIADEPEVDILSLLPEACKAIDDGINCGGILVHCDAGVSRSASFVIGYLIWKRGIGFDEALRIVRESRPRVQPNAGFERQLRLFSENPVTSVADQDG